MRKTTWVLALAIVVLAPMSAFAHHRIRVVTYYPPAVVTVAPVVEVAPVVTYVRPAPVVITNYPPPVVVYPRRVYYAPVRVVEPAPIYVVPGR